MVRTIAGVWLSFYIFVLPLCAAAPRKLELAENWKLASVIDVPADGAAISRPDYQDGNWYPVHRMPGTVLEILQEDGVYPNLYYGKNMLERVPQDLYQHDWWYRTTFTPPAGHAAYTLEFPGINYRAEIWLNGQRIADSKQIVGMYAAHELNVTKWIRPGFRNALAVKVTPERLIQDATGVELADSWFDWLNWKYLGYHGEFKTPPLFGVSFVPDRNAGVWKPVYLKMTGDVTLQHAWVNSELSLPQSIARLTVYADLHNLSAEPVGGTLEGAITRKGKPAIELRQAVRLTPGQELCVEFAPEKYSNLIVTNPDLWWPYTVGKPNLYELHLDFLQNNQVSDRVQIPFGIRRITQNRDNDEQFPDFGKGGNFYLQINGRDFLVRGADYTPDLLYRYDPEREAQILAYVKDLGLNMLRWESKISSEHIIDLADEEGIPLMFGWMCCNQWEKWDQWSEEDHRVARESLRSQILMLRPHASVIVWASGSDGRPPQSVLKDYHQILSDLHWPNATVDTVSSFAKGANGDRLWDGILMEGPYSWRPPNYWFAGEYVPSRGASVEEGDNEHIPTLESLKKFIPPDKLWPINDTWHFHAGAIPGASTLADIQKAVDHRYGPSSNVEEFVRKAQLAHYENTRAQFEDFAASGWSNHKVTMYWMLNSHWPSFYGNIVDYYLSPNGTYYGAKTGLRPLSVVFDAYAREDHSAARIIVFNQTPLDQRGLRARVRIYDLDGKLRDDRSADDVQVETNGAVQVLTLPRYPQSSPVFFVRCQLFASGGKLVSDNTYWQSQKDDDLGGRSNDSALILKQVNWADMTALNTMLPVSLGVSAELSTADGQTQVTIHLRNSSEHIAFFERATITASEGGNEILPIRYDDNYITVYPGESAEIHGTVAKAASPKWVRLEGYNTPPLSVPIM